MDYYSFLKYGNDVTNWIFLSGSSVTEFRNKAGTATALVLRRPCSGYECQGRWSRFWGLRRVSIFSGSWAITGTRLWWIGIFDGWKRHGKTRKKTGEEVRLNIIFYFILTIRAPGRTRTKQGAELISIGFEEQSKSVSF